MCVYSCDVNIYASFLNILSSDYPQKFDETILEAPANIKWKEEMTVNDLVKDYSLPFLPAKALLRLRSVSKEWARWISNPFFAHRQSYSFQKLSGYFYQSVDGEIRLLSLDHSAYGVPTPDLSFMPERISILSSCNGLLLCRGLDSLYVCNPTTQEMRCLPPSEYYFGFEPAAVLVFEPSLRDIEAYYLVICAVPLLDFPVIKFEIYSSLTRSWRQGVPIELEGSSLKGPGFYMKGIAYWETTSGSVIAYNIKDELPGIVSLPAEAHVGGTLTQLGDELCYVTAENHPGNVLQIDIHCGLEMSLKRSVCTDLGLMGEHLEYKVLQCVNSDAVMIYTKGTATQIYCYHLGDGRVEVFEMPKGVSSMAKFLPYINSLTAVPDACCC